MFRLVVINLLLILAYLLGGKMAMAFSLPPGYAMPIFPPAGLALAAVLLGGWRYLPGLWLGSLIFNAAVVSPKPDFGHWLPYSIATGSAVQAWIAAALLRRFDQDDGGFRHHQSVGLFVLISFSSCLIAATWGCGSLLQAGVISQQDCGANWFSWWLGDVLGCQIFGLMILLLFRQGLKWPDRRAAIVAGGFLASFLVCCLVYSQEKRTVNQRIQDHLEDYADIQVTQLTRILSSHLTALQASQALFRQGEVSHEEFERFCRTAMPYPSAFRALQYASLIQAADWPRIQALAADHYHRPVTLRSPAGAILQPLDGMVPVIYICPFSGNEEVLGMVMSAEMERGAALARAKERGSSSVVIKLVQDPQGPGALLFILPVQRQGRDHGFVVAVFDLRIFNSLLIGKEGESIHWSLHERNGATLLTSSPEPEADSISCSREVAVFDQNWSLVFHLNPRQAEISAQNRPLLLLTLLLCAGFCSTLLLLSGGNREAPPRAA